MPLNLKCPSCRQPAIVPETALDRRARCTFCHSIYAVREALAIPASPESLPAQRVHVDEGMPRSEKLILWVGLGISAILSLAFAIYWFGIRDTWEFDNYLTIVGHCEKVERAIERADDDAAIRALSELESFIGPRSFQRDTLAVRIDALRQAIVPVTARAEHARREREAAELIQRKQRDALARAEGHDRTIREAATIANRPRERYYRDGKGVVISESEAEEQIEAIRTRIDSMPNNAERAFLKGVLRAVEDEWGRIQRQGPIEP